MGDSVPFQALFDLADTLGADRKIAFVYSGLGLEIRDVLPPTRDAIWGDHPPDVFLVFIGTHQSNTDPPEIWRAELRRLLTLVSRRVDCIRVFEIDDKDTGFYRRHDRQAATYNRITRQVTEEYADRRVVPLRRVGRPGRAGVRAAGHPPPQPAGRPGPGPSHAGRGQQL